MTRARRIAGVAAVVAIAAGLALARSRPGAGAPPPAPTRAVAAPTLVGSAPAAHPAVAPSSRFAVGTQRVYDLAATHAIALTAADGQAGQAFEVEVAGAWTLTVVAADERGARVRGELDGAMVVRVDGRGALAPAEVAALEAELAAPCFFELLPDGRLAAVQVAPATTDAVRNLHRTLGAGIQLSLPAGAPATWQAEEADVTGAYLASYRRRGARLDKRKLRYLTVAAGPAAAHAAAYAVDARLDAELDEVDWPVTLDAAETQTVAPYGGQPGVAATARVTLRRTGAGRVADTAGVPAGYVREPVTATAEASTRARDRELVAGAGYRDLLDELAASGDDPAAHASLLARFGALFRLEPAAAAEAAATLRGDADPLATQVLTAALGEAGSAAAQRALVEVVTAAASADVRAHGVVALGLADAPSSDAVAALVSADADPDADLRAVAALALGNAAARLGAEPARAAAIVDELLARLGRATSAPERVRYLRALGNTGDPRALPALEAALAAPAPQVRAAAVEALRFVPGPRADALVRARLLGDPDAQVRRAAVFAAGFRARGEVAAELEQARAADPSDEVRAAAAAALARLT